VAPQFQRRGQDIARKVEAVAASETVQRIALEILNSTFLSDLKLPCRLHPPELPVPGGLSHLR